MMLIVGVMRFVAGIMVVGGIMVVVGSDGGGG